MAWLQQPYAGPANRPHAPGGYGAVDISLTDEKIWSQAGPEVFLLLLILLVDLFFLDSVILVLSLQHGDHDGTT